MNRPSFAVGVASRFATRRIRGHVVAASDPKQFESFGLVPEFSIVASGAPSSIGTPIPLRPRIDEPGAQDAGPFGETFFNTASTPRESWTIAVGSKQLVQDARLYSDLLGTSKGGVYMKTGLSSLRATRDVFRVFDACVPLIGGDIAAEHIWPMIAKKNVRKLMLSSLSRRLVLKLAPRGIMEQTAYSSLQGPRSQSY